MIRIITDSTADIPREDIQTLGVRVVPLQVNIDGQMFRDGLDLEPESFYEMPASPPRSSFWRNLSRRSRRATRWCASRFRASSPARCKAP